MSENAALMEERIAGMNEGHGSLTWAVPVLTEQAVAWGRSWHSQLTSRQRRRLARVVALTAVTRLVLRE